MRRWVVCKVSPDCGEFNCIHFFPHIECETCKESCPHSHAAECLRTTLEDGEDG